MSSLLLSTTAQQKLSSANIDAASVSRETTFPSVVNVLMDTTYFGRNFGVMVFKDSISGVIYTSNM